MRRDGEVLRLELEGWADRGTAGLVRSVLRSRPGGYEDSGSDEPSLVSRLDGWLFSDNSPKNLYLSLEDVEICARIIKGQSDIAEDTPGRNERNGTSTPHNISQARTLLPKMREFMEAHGVEVGEIFEPVSSDADYNEEDGREHSESEGGGREAGSQA